MKSNFLKITLLAFITVGAMSCKNNEKNADVEVAEAAEATETAVAYTVDTAASTIKWEGKKPTATHHGTISLADGTLFVNNGEIEAGDFTIDMKSIKVEDLEGESKANLEAHLMGTVEGKEGDFFNTNKYPTAKFELTGMENNMVKGNLTIKDKTNAVAFPAKVAVDGDKITFTSESFEIDRTKWGANFGSKSVFDNLGDKFVHDEIKLTVTLTATKK